MSHVRRILSTVAAGVLVTGAMTAAISAPVTSGNTARATAADCKSEYGFSRISYDKHDGTSVYTVPLGDERNVDLYFAPMYGALYGYARISGKTQKGDLVWLDWSDARPGWMQCGPFAVQDAGFPNTSAAKKRDAVPEHWIRACGRAQGHGSKCGSWWH